MLILVRHGRTAANASGLLLGRLDVGLDDEGRRQADRLAAAVAVAHDVARVVSSPLLRTQATADAIGAAVGVGVDLDERWIELDYGELDGTPLAEVPAATWREWRADPAFCPPGGESLVALRRRVEEGIADLLVEAAERDVVVVSHVSPIKAAVAWALDVGDQITWRLFVAPASISCVRVAGPSPALVGFNATDHLS